MRFNQFSLSLFLLLYCLVVKAQAQAYEETNSLFKNTAFQVWAGFSIGGNAPFPFPTEITQIEHYDPTLALKLEASVTRWFAAKKNWGLRTGLCFEGKGMKTAAQVKSYYTEVIGDGGQKISGNFTGMVQSNVKNSYATIPLLLTHSISDKWNIYAGPYFSALIEKNFSGYVYDGYLREGSPTGEKIVFEGENKGPYDFSQELNIFQWGLMLGGEWLLNRNFSVFGDLTWSLNNLFKSNFEAISFKMHSIYLNVGFGYTF